MKNDTYQKTILILSSVLMILSLSFGGMLLADYLIDMNTQTEATCVDCVSVDEMTYTVYYEYTYDGNDYQIATKALHSVKTGTKTMLNIDSHNPSKIKKLNVKLLIFFIALFAVGCIESLRAYSVPKNKRLSGGKI